MAVVRCEFGHFYDNEKFMTCPHCADKAGADEDDKTRALSMFGEQNDFSIGIDGFLPPHMAGDFDSDKTVGFFSSVRGNDFVTGWLVCVEGPERGRDYRLHNGFNKIGRSKSLDIYIEEDDHISRSPHCAVVYEFKKNVFYVVAQGGNITYVNDEALSESVELKTGDIIEIGNSKFEFVAFCRGDRKWEKAE